MAFVDILEHMGCTRRRASRTRRPSPAARSAGVDVDMNAISDTVMTLGRRRPVRRRASPGSATSPTSATRRPTGSPPSRPSCASSARPSTSMPDGLVIVPPDRQITARADRHVRRPPDGHVVRPRRPQGGRGDDPRPRLRRQDLSGVLGRPVVGSRPELERSTLVAHRRAISVTSCAVPASTAGSIRAVSASAAEAHDKAAPTSRIRDGRRRSARSRDPSVRDPEGTRGRGRQLGRGAAPGDRSAEWPTPGASRPGRASPCRH